MTNEEKAKEIVNYVLNPKCANGSNGLGLLNTHNQRNADLNNIYKCSEEIALQAMQWKDEQFLQWLKETLTKETFTMFTSESQGVINFEPVIKEFEKFIKH